LREQKKRAALSGTALSRIQFNRCRLTYLGLVPLDEPLLLPGIELEPGCCAEDPLGEERPEVDLP
jgi:hypothetical protein